MLKLCNGCTFHDSILRPQLLSFTMCTPGTNVTSGAVVLSRGGFAPRGHVAMTEGRHFGLSQLGGWVLAPIGQSPGML